MNISNFHLLRTCTIIFALIFLSACNSQSSSPIAVSATSTSTVSTHSFRFSDWRVAYLAEDDYIHAISLDGKSDDVSAFSILFKWGFNTANAYISSDGYTYAYAQDDFLIYDLNVGNITITGDRIIAAYTLFWSSDGSYLAAGDNITNFWTVNMATHTSTHVPYAPPPDKRAELLGWADAHHLAIMRNTTSTYIFSSIDISTGHEHVIATIPIADISGTLYWSLSPDGSLILLNNHPFRDNPYTPVVLTINTSTGAITHLSHIAQMTGSDFLTVAWRTGDPHTVAVAPNGSNQVWMLHVQTDTATQFATNNFPTVWSPDGRTLILSTGWYGEASGSGSYTLTAMTFDSADKVASQVELTKNAYALPLVGFAKTA
jgi:hypothetical protein